jgi:hypothetical protein
MPSVFSECRGLGCFFMANDRHDIAREHANAFFQDGRHKDLLAIAKHAPEARWRAICEKKIGHRLSHLRGIDWQNAHDEIVRRLRERAGFPPEN